jgi:hypothetical protein
LNVFIFPKAWVFSINHLSSTGAKSILYWQVRCKRTQIKSIPHSIHIQKTKITMGEILSDELAWQQIL